VIIFKRGEKRGGCDGWPTGEKAGAADGTNLNESDPFIGMWCLTHMDRMGSVQETLARMSCHGEQEIMTNYHEKRSAVTETACSGSRHWRDAPK